MGVPNRWLYETGNRENFLETDNLQFANIAGSTEVEGGGGAANSRAVATRLTTEIMANFTIGYSDQTSEPLPEVRVVTEWDLKGGQ